MFDLVVFYLVDFRALCSDIKEKKNGAHLFDN